MHAAIRKSVEHSQLGPDRKQVEEGAIGAGAGTICFGWKGGIGTSSRRLADSLGGFTVGVLVQSNFGGVLTICGAPVGEELGRFYLKEHLGSARSRVQQARTSSSAAEQKQSEPSGDRDSRSAADGSIMIVVATDAPLDHRNLKRLALRSMFGLARTGSSGSNGSGDYAIAFSTARKTAYGPAPQPLANDAVSPLFLAVIEATEEAIYNSLFRAHTVTSFAGTDKQRTVDAVPIEQTLEILRNHRA